MSKRDLSLIMNKELSKNFTVDTLVQFTSPLKIQKYIDAAKKANLLGLGINAGHDLSLDNIAFFAKNIPGLLEVSIGHALICESLYLGFENVIPMYLQRLSS